jgi:membrane protein YqaA with SNARE-associated domain
MGRGDHPHQGPHSDPFKLVTIASGLAAFNFPLFVLTALVTRGARFFLIARC